MADFLGKSADGNYYFFLALIAAISILIFFREYRKKFLIFVVLGIVIANPWFKDLWSNKLNISYYWRLLWIVPVIPLCASLPTMITERIKNQTWKGFTAIGFALIFVFTGSLVYLYPDNTFDFPAKTASGISLTNESLAKELLQLEEYPRVVADRRVAYYLREYDGKIQTMYGRDAFGYIYQMSDVATSVDREINKQEDGDMMLVANAMRENDYHYLISAISVEERLKRLEEAGFRKISSVSHWGIFELTTPDEVKE